MIVVYCSGDGSGPSLKFRVTKESIEVCNNENGFTEKNIRAICDVGRSTKGKHKSGYIGMSFFICHVYWKIVLFNCKIVFTPLRTPTYYVCYFGRLVVCNRSGGDRKGDIYWHMFQVRRVLGSSLCSEWPTARRSIPTASTSNSTSTAVPWDISCLIGRHKKRAKAMTSRSKQKQWQVGQSKTMTSRSKQKQWQVGQSKANTWCRSNHKQWHDVGQIKK